MIPNQLIEKFNNTIIEWLDKGEKPDYNYSRECDGRWVILTKERAIFAIEKDSNLCYLFDSKELLNDWKENGSKLVRYKTEDIFIHVYLLIALRVEGKNFECISSDFSIIEEKFLKIISALPEGKVIRIVHQFVNLLPFEGWAGDYYWKCINLGLPVLGAKIGAEEVASSVLKTPEFVNKDKTGKENLWAYSYFHNYTFLMGDVCLMRDEYEEARKFFEILVESDTEDELVQARYSWALGMEEWKKHREGDALECFEKAKGYFDKLDDKMYSKLMDFLKSSIYAMEDVKPYSSQLIFLEFGEVPENGERAEVAKRQEQESKDFSEVISFIKERFDALEGTLTSKDKKELEVAESSKKEPKGGKAEYKIPKEIEINFSKDANYIKIDGKEIPITKKQEFFLLEELLNKKIVHWSDGFILFGSWQDRSPARPVNQFWRVVSELNKIVGFRLVVSKKKYHLAFAPNIKIRSTILEANELCKEAKKETRTDKAIDKLKTAISLYPMSITTWELLIDIIQKNPNQKLEEDLISASEVFVKRERDLDAAIKRVQAEGDDKEWKGIWKEAWLYISKMSFELKEVRRYKIIVDKLRGEEKVNTNEVNCYSLVELIREIKKREISDYGKDIKSMSLFKDPIIMDCLKTVVNTVIQKARDGNIFNVERNDVIGITSSCFWILIKERDFTYKDTSSFKSYLKTSLLKMVLDQLRHEE